MATRRTERQKEFRWQTSNCTCRGSRRQRVPRPPPDKPKFQARAPVPVPVQVPCTKQYTPITLLLAVMPRSLSLFLSVSDVSSCEPALLT
jgi:hypothetical protein